MAKILDKDPATYDRERDAFLKDLQHFHDTRGTPIKRHPKINGLDIDLYLLYALVTSRGGWIKVNSKNEWGSILESFKIPRKCVNSGVALKQIYLRYLDRYEKVNFLGEVGERSNDDDEDSRHRRWSARSLHSVPLTYNYSQHTVADNSRTYNGLSTELYKPSDYDKLALSLISPLPNEQDFAINVCTLLSNESKHTLKLEKHPRLLRFLLAHAAVFDHSSTKELFFEVYNKVRGHSMSNFWTDIIDDKESLALLDESKYIKRKKCRYIGYYDLIAEEKRKSDAAGTSVEDDDVILCDSETGLKLLPEDKELFCLGRSLGTQDYVGQRVLQIATILRNLTFTEENVSVMGKDVTFLRFVLLCCCSRWNSLHQLGFDMLANIASEVTMLDVFLDPLLNIINKGLESQDRNIVLSCVEILNKLGQNERNEELLLRCLDDKVYDRLCTFLTLQDIMLLVHTLECLYSLSSLGERSCNAIVRIHGSLDTLVSLITVEAQSYGPKACILMRVVETISNSSQSNNTPSNVQSSAPAGTPATSSVTTSVASSGPPTSTPMPLPAPSIARPVNITSTSIANNILTSSNTTPTSMNVSQGVITPNVITTTIAQAHSRKKKVIVPVTTGHTTQQVAQENEQFAINWLRSSFELAPGSRIEQGELYKQYITTCAKIGRRGVIAPNHFPRCVRNAFGQNIGPRQMTVGDTIIHNYEGLQVKVAKVIITSIAQSPSCNSSVQQTSSPIATQTVPQQLTQTSQLMVPTSLQQTNQIQRPSTPQLTTQQTQTSAVFSTVTNVVTSTSAFVSSAPSLPVSPILKAQLCAPPKPSTATASTNTNMIGVQSKSIKKEIKSKVSSHPHLSQALHGFGAANVPAISTIASTATVSTEMVSSAPSTMVAIISSCASAPISPTSVSSTTTEANSGASTSLIKSLLANKVTDIQQVSVSSATASSLFSGPTHCIAMDRAQFEQVTQRQRMLQQQHTIQTTAVVQSVQATQQSALAQIRASTPSPIPGNVTFVNNTPKLVTSKAAVSKINGIRPTVKQFEAAVEAKIHSEMQVQTDDEIDSLTQAITTSVSQAMTLINSNSSTGNITVAVGGNHTDTTSVPQQQMAVAIPSWPDSTCSTNSISSTNSVNSTSTVTVSATNSKPFSNARLDMDDSNSTGNYSIASSGIRDNCSTTGGEENENSVNSFSFDGFVNGVPQSLDVDDTTSKDSAPKSLMLADLLEKTLVKCEPPPMCNGSLRLVERSLEMSTPPNKQITPGTTMVSTYKRPSDDISIEPDAKRVHINGDAINNEETPEEGSVSSTAANLYAALAADVAGEEEMEEEQAASIPTQPLIVTHGPPQRQILVTAGGQIALQQRVAVMGQHYVVAQPQTALVQGQTQTVLVAQTPQQQGTGTKTIIILQPSAQAPQQTQTQPQQQQQQQKMLVQRLQSPPPPPLMATSSTNTGQTLKMVRTTVSLSSNLNQQTPVIVSSAMISQHNFISTQNSTITNVSISNPSLVPTNQTVVMSQNHPAAMVHHGTSVVTPVIQSTALQTTPNVASVISSTQQIVNANSVTSVAASNQFKTTTINRTNQSVIRPNVNGTMNSVTNTQQSVGVSTYKNVSVTSASTSTMVSANQSNASVSSTGTITSSTATSTTVVIPQGHFLCEWRGCMRNFKTANEVYMHACECHCPQGSQEIQCLWERCDAMKRKRFSLMTHLYDRHCNIDVLRMMAVRRKQLSVTGRSEIPAPTPPTPHPGYAPNAAFHAIKRHALEFVNPKELQDDNEGPVTKSIRLTSALILRNLVIYSTYGRRYLTSYEPHLASVALSNVESSRTIAQVLFDMSQPR